MPVDDAWKKEQQAKQDAVQQARKKQNPTEGPPMMLKFEDQWISGAQYAEIAAKRGQPVYWHKDMPYRLDGNIFVDPAGRKIIAPPEVIAQAICDGRHVANRATINPTAVRCDTRVSDHPQEPASTASTMPNADKADVPAPPVGPSSEVTGTAGEMDWSGYHHLNLPHDARKLAHDMHVGDRASTERFLAQRARVAEVHAQMGVRPWDGGANPIGRNQPSNKAVGGLDPNAQPPQPASAARADLVDKLTAEVMGLINSKPRSPTKDEIAGVIDKGLVAVQMAFDAQALSSHPGFLLIRGSGPGPFGLHPTGYLDKDGQVAAFAGFTQYDGPKMREYTHVEADRTEHFMYQTIAWHSHAPTKIMDRLADLARQMKDKGVHTIVWRTRPELTHEYDCTVDAKIWRFYCRFHTLPYMKLDGAKDEGEVTSEA